MLIRYNDSWDAITNFVSLTVIPKSCTVSKPSAIFTCEERNTWRGLNYRWLPVPSEHIRDLVDFLIRSCMIIYFHIWFWRAIRTQRKSSFIFAESVFKIFIRLEYFLYRVQYYEWNLKRKEKRSTPWVNFDDTSKFCGEKYIGSSRLNIYRFSFASHLRMAHELSLKVYKVKACLLRLQCRVSSKI